MKNKKYFIIVVIIFLLSILFLPLLLDILIFGNTVESNISNDSWASFLGGYIGAINSGLFSLVGIIFTIKFSSLQNRKDRQLQISPYLSIKYERKNQLTTPKNKLDDILFSVNDDSTETSDLFGIVYIKNVGFGPAINCYIDDVKLNDEYVCRATKILKTDIIDQGETYGISIGIYSINDKIDNLRTRKDEYLNYLFPTSGSLNMKPSFLTFSIFYSDLIGTKFMQNISLKLSTCVIGENNIWKYNHDLYLVDITERKDIV